MISCQPHVSFLTGRLKTAAILPIFFVWSCDIILGETVNIQSYWHKNDKKVSKETFFIVFQPISRALRQVIQRVFLLVRGKIGLHWLTFVSQGR